MTRKYITEVCREILERRSADRRAQSADVAAAALYDISKLTNLRGEVTEYEHVVDAVRQQQAALAECRKALAGSRCPVPISDPGDQLWLTTEECVKRGECGCIQGGAMTRAALSGKGGA